MVVTLMVTLEDITQSKSSFGANPTQADGSYTNSIFDFGGSLTEGDQIKTTVFSKDGTTELGSKTQTAPAPDEVTGFIIMVIDVDLVPQATVTLDSPGPSTWTYALTHTSGIITSWTY